MHLNGNANGDQSTFMGCTEIDTSELELDNPVSGVYKLISHRFLPLSLASLSHWHLPLTAILLSLPSPSHCHLPLAAISLSCCHLPLALAAIAHPLLLLSRSLTAISLSLWLRFLCFNLLVSCVFLSDSSSVRRSGCFSLCCSFYSHLLHSLCRSVTLSVSLCHSF